MAKLTEWEKAKKIAEKQCPYRQLGSETLEGDACSIDPYDEDEARDYWLPGFAYGYLGVPDDYMLRENTRYFWQGYEAGVVHWEGQ